MITLACVAGMDAKTGCKWIKSGCLPSEKPKQVRTWRTSGSCAPWCNSSGLLSGHYLIFLAVYGQLRQCQTSFNCPCVQCHGIETNFSKRAFTAFSPKICITAWRSGVFDLRVSARRMVLATSATIPLNSVGDFL